MSYNVEINQAEMNRLLRSRGGPVARELLRRGKRVEAGAKGYVGVDTGRLRSSITTLLVFRADGSPAAQVGTNVNYAAYHHDGVGVFGSGQPIRPKRAGGRLVFKPKGSKVKVYARQVQGYKGTKFLQKALNDEFGR